MANFITIFRVILMFIGVYLIYAHLDNQAAGIWALILTILAFAMDGLDGYVARKFNESSKLGALLDIMSDRIVENTFWILFAVMGWLPILFPLIAITRGFITDTIRSAAMEKGYTAFGASTMMQNKICHFLTASRFSRALYGAAKSLVFLFLIIAYIPNLEYFNGMSINAFARFAYIQPCLITIADILVYVTVLMCIIRGVPVLIESRRFINNDKKQV